MKVFHIRYSEYPNNNIEVDATVSIQDNFIWDQDMIEAMRTMLAEFYDVTVRCVLTQEEMDARETILNASPADAPDAT